MRKNTKALSLVLTTGILAGALTGCGHAQTAPTAADSGAGNGSRRYQLEIRKSLVLHPNNSNRTNKFFMRRLRSSLFLQRLKGNNYGNSSRYQSSYDYPQTLHHEKDGDRL